MESPNLDFIFDIQRGEDPNAIQVISVPAWLISAQKQAKWL
jgi:hypothetical protein